MQLRQSKGPRPRMLPQTRQTHAPTHTRPRPRQRGGHAWTAADDAASEKADAAAAAPAASIEPAEGEAVAAAAAGGLWRQPLPPAAVEAAAATAAAALKGYRPDRLTSPPAPLPWTGAGPAGPVHSPGPSGPARPVECTARRPLSIFHRSAGGGGGGGE